MKKTLTRALIFFMLGGCAKLFSAGCPTGTLQDYINLGSTGCTLSTAGVTAHASNAILLANFSYSTSVTGTATAKAASAIAVRPAPGTREADYAGLMFMAGQTSWTDPGDLAAAGGTLTATLKFTATAVGFPSHGILAQVSVSQGLVFSAASSLKTEELFCVGALFGVGNSCAGFLSFDDSLGFSLSDNRGTGHVHLALADPSFPPIVPNVPLGVGLIDVVAQFTITGATGANAGVSNYLVMLAPTP